MRSKGRDPALIPTAALEGDMEKHLSGVHRLLTSPGLPLSNGRQPAQLGVFSVMKSLSPSVTAFLSSVPSFSSFHPFPVLPSFLPSVPLSFLPVFPEIGVLPRLGH